MKFSTVEIRPRAFCKDKWDVSFQDQPGEREPGQGSINITFFHYPRRIGKKAAFEKIKIYMIEQNKKDIAIAQKIIRELESLTFKE